MEIEQQTRDETKKGSKKEAKKINQLKKLDLETIKLLNSIKDRANKKTFGRKVKDTEIISAALRLISSEHIKELQELTLSERDRLAMAHEEFQKANGKISLDQFIGKLLKGEIRQQQ
ncbi:MAG: hypothetical protein ACK4VO_12980 [Pseudobdellovibrio sp.]